MVVRYEASIYQSETRLFFVSKKNLFSYKKFKVFPDFSIIGFGVIAIIRQNFVSGDIGANSY